MRRAKDKLRDNVINRVNSMGLNVPSIWKDELFQNELAKLDIKMEIDKTDTLKYGKKERTFDLKKYDNRYFDKN